MNNNVSTSIVQIEKENLKKLLEEVKETVAINLNNSTPVSKQKSFGVVDLWNCQRSIKSATSSRKY